MKKSNVVYKLLENMKPEERDEIHQWAQEIQAEMNNSKNQPKVERIQHLIVITNKHKVILPLLKQVLLLFKKHSWEDRNWATRLALAGAITALGTVGLSGAGIASFGIGIGLPIFLLTAAGGALIGVIIDTCNDIRKKDKDQMK